MNNRPKIKPTKIEVSNSPAELDELVNRANSQKDFVVNLVSSRETPKDDPEAAINLLKTFLDMLQMISTLQYDVARALKHTQY